MSPAKISRVTIIDPLEKHMEVIVDDSQLSLAIGKKGQNVRLAAKLLGWKIDIKSEEEKRQEVESAMAALVPAGAPVSVLIDYGLGEEMVEKLVGRRRRHHRKAGRHDAGRAGRDPRHRIRRWWRRSGIAVNAYYGQFEEAGRRPPRRLCPRTRPNRWKPRRRSREAELSIEEPEPSTAGPRTAAPLRTWKPPPSRKTLRWLASLIP